MSTGSPHPEAAAGEGRAATAIPHPSGDAGATNTPNPGPSATTSGQDGSGDLRARLAGLVRQPFDGPVSTPTEAYALAVADAVLADGFRRVVEDDGTIERLAEVLAKADGWFPWIQPFDVEQEVAVVDDIKDGFRSMARAVVRALREDT